MRVPIPGSGIATQVRLPSAPSDILRLSPAMPLAVSVQLSVPTFLLTDAAGVVQPNPDKNAVSHVSISIDFVTTLAGSTQLAPITLIVELVHPKAAIWIKNASLNEKISNDGRNFYAYTQLSSNPARAFITPGSSLMASSAFDNIRNFSFTITRNNLNALISALNAERKLKALPLLSADLLSIRFHDVLLRNETSRLNNGLSHFGDASVQVKFKSIEVTGLIKQ